jgi:hypothetical protein
MVIIGVLLNLIAAAGMFFCGMATEDNLSPKYSGSVFFILWFIFNTVSMLILAR